MNADEGTEEDRGSTDVSRRSSRLREAWWSAKAGASSSRRGRGPELKDRRCPEDWAAVFSTGVWRASDWGCRGGRCRPCGPSLTPPQTLFGAAVGAGPTEVAQKTPTEIQGAQSSAGAWTVRGIAAH
ncbi:hypothetical protein NDU88_005284 [Pleurodeles waltl]|uniref:Uncharacterized protein n=1 Tax=Pleurodeles waltl TaxID=8319 RepID=A0AAV7TA18_PLEWA|nr:hypothetical protein NDU88_005284 [Pleurodeles waltl]